MGHRVSWALADQAMSSASNLVIGLAAAHLLGVTGYGIFAILFTTYALVLGVHRGLVTEPLVVSGGEAPARAEGASVHLGIVVGVVLVVGGAFADTRLRYGLFALAVSMPFLLWQDALRYRFLASRRPHLAFLMDAAWFVLLVGAGLVVGRQPPLPVVVACWAGSASVAAMIGAVRERAWPEVANGMAWIRHHRSIGVRFSVEFLVVNGLPQVVLLLLAVLSGYAEAGAYRGAVVLLGPAALAGIGTAAAVQPEIVRLGRGSRGNERVAIAAVSGVGVLALVWTAVLIALPLGVGEFVLGDVWALARPVVLPLGLTITGTTVSAVGVGLLHALGAAGKSLRASVLGSTTMFVAGVVGLALGGAVGAAWGQALPAWFAAGLVLRALFATLRQQARY